jgi:subtilisin family serine protease
VALRDEHVDINSERVVSAALLTPGADDDATDAYSPFAQLGVDTTSYTGKDVTIALLDSGTPTHADLTGAFADESNFTLYENLNEDNYGHATHCAGLMVGPRASGGYGVAPEAKVLYGRVLDRNGDGLDMSVISGIVWAIRKKAKIIVMCLGSPVPPYSTPDIYYRKAAAAATGKGILLLAAAGNKIIGSNAPVHHPANCLEIPAVGAVLRNLQPAPFSCVYEPEGDTVEMVTPGELLRSSWLNNSYRRYSGTSMSCALAAGLGALWIQQGSANPLNDLITHVINGVVQAP